jgi:voltage-gated potassium channel Kch
LQLLANTNYRAQIQADILPFKGILLGIFFMDAGSTFDSELVLREFPTIIVGALGLLAFKIITLGAATRVPQWMEPNRLSKADALKVTLLLAGGGEFAFVVLALSEKLELIPNDLGSILTAIVLITMGITPLLGIAADKLSNALEPEEEIVTSPKELNGSTSTNGYQHSVNGNDTNGIMNGNVGTTLGRDSIVVCGYGEIGRSLIRALDSEVDIYKKVRDNARTEGLNIVAFDIDEALVDSNIKPTEHSIVLYGNGCNAEVIRSSGISTPSAIFVAYEDHSRVLSATSRLRTTFRDTPIYARASIRAEVNALRKAGATEVVVEADEMPRAAPALIRGVWGGNLAGEYPTDSEQLRQAAAAAAGVSLAKVDDLLELFAAMDQNTSGLVSGRGIEDVLSRSSNFIASDEQIQKLDDWIQSTLKDSDPLDEIEFCRLYGRAPDFVKDIFALPSDTTRIATK